MQPDKIMARLMKTCVLSFDPSEDGADTVYLVSDHVWADSDRLAGDDKITRLEELIEDRIGKRIHVKVVHKGQADAKDRKLRAIAVEKNLRNITGGGIEIESEE